MKPCAVCGNPRLHHPNASCESYIASSPRPEVNEARSPDRLRAVSLGEALRGESFSIALEALKAGRRVTRAGWNGRGMFLYLVEGSQFRVNREPLLSILGPGTIVDYQAHIDMKTASGSCVPWLASQTDLLANDWLEVVDTTSTEIRSLIR